MSPFSELVTDVSAGSPKIKQSDYLADGLLPVIDQGAEPVAGFVDDINAKSMTPLPLIIFGDHTRRFKFVDYPFAVGADGVKLLKMSDRLDAKYAFHFFRSISLPNAGYSRHYKFLREVTIPLPPLPEQRRIASILDHADSLRALLTQQKVSLRALEDSVLQSMTQIAGQPRVALKTFATLITKGTTPTSLGMEFASCGVPFIRAQNIVDGQVILESNPLYVSESTHAALGRSKVVPGDILVTIAGTIGRAAVVAEGQGEMNCNQAVAIVRPREDAPTPYILAWLRSPQGHAAMHAGSVTATIANFSLAQLGSLSVPVPDQSRLGEYATDSATIAHLRSHLSDRMTKLDELFASLQHRAFRGEL